MCIQCVFNQIQTHSPPPPDPLYHVLLSTSCALLITYRVQLVQCVHRHGIICGNVGSLPGALKNTDSSSSSVTVNCPWFLSFWQSFMSPPPSNRDLGWLDLGLVWAPTDAMTSHVLWSHGIRKTFCMMFFKVRKRKNVDERTCEL